MLKEHSIQYNGTWTAGINLKVYVRYRELERSDTIVGPNDGQENIGLFFQDREQFSSTIVQRRRMRATWLR